MAHTVSYSVLTVCIIVCQIIAGIDCLEHDMGALSWLNVETLERVPTLPLWQTCNVLCPWILFHKAMVLGFHPIIK